MAFEYGGDRNGDDDLKELEVEEKQQLFDSTITAPVTRSYNQEYNKFIVNFKTLLYNCSSEDRAMGTLLEAGVCMRVPFSRVTIKQPPKMLEKTEEVDIAGVCIVFL